MTVMNAIFLSSIVVVLLLREAATVLIKDDPVGYRSSMKSGRFDRFAFMALLIVGTVLIVVVSAIGSIWELVG